MVDGNYIDKIISALDPQKGETIIEIGPGRGALTEKLIESGARVMAIELERDMIAILNQRFGTCENFRLIENNVLKVDFQEIRNLQSEIRNPKLVANLPYYISTAILQKLIEQREVFSEMILMFQREVVDRITAKPGSKERGFLTVLVEAYLETEKLFDVPPTAFRPPPKVWSSIISLAKPEKSEAFSDAVLFKELISAGFTQKRKTILNNLKNAPADLKKKLGNAEKLLADCEIDPGRRAETLTLDEWRSIYKAIESN